MNFPFDYSMQDNAIRVIEEGARASVITDTAFIAHEIERQKTSGQYKWMITGEEYYEGRQDILRKQRTAIGEEGNLTTITNLPNNRLIDNVYKRMVIQKYNYICGRPFTATSKDDAYNGLLGDLFNKRFMKLIKNVSKDSLNCGIAWLYPYYDENGEFRTRRFKSHEIIPEWKDEDHTELDSFIRFYTVESWDGLVDKTVTKVEYYTLRGVDYYEYWNGQLVSCAPYHTDYMTKDGVGYNWQRIPLVAFKYNDEEQPLILNCKSLQDGVNEILSRFQDNMEEDSRNTILVLVNYDGENLGEFRRNLATYGVVKVRSDANAQGGDVKTLQVEVNAENYKAILEILKKAIVENCMGYDAKDEKSSGTPNQMNIQSMYNDIDQDASNMETEFQSALDDLLYFYDIYLANAGYGDFSDTEVQITFNMDMPMDESTVIDNINKSAPLLSQETLLARHPWVSDAQTEIDKINDEKRKNIDDYAEAFKNGGDVKNAGQSVLEGETDGA